MIITTLKLYTKFYTIITVLQVEGKLYKTKNIAL